MCCVLPSCVENHLKAAIFLLSRRHTLPSAQVDWCWHRGCSIFYWRPFAANSCQMMQVAFEVHCRIHLRQFSAPFLKLARKYFPLDRDIFDFAMNLKYLKGNFFFHTYLYGWHMSEIKVKDEVNVTNRVWLDWSKETHIHRYWEGRGVYFNCAWHI